MKLFLDTANIDEIKTIASWGVLDGVTTNPSLVAKEKAQDESKSTSQNEDKNAPQKQVNFEQRVKEICKIVSGPVSVEVIATDLDGMLAEGRGYAKWAKNIVVKVPMTPAGLQAVQTFSKENIRTNVTLCFSPNQALLAAKAGATFVSPFVGRLDDIGEDGVAVIREIIQIFQEYSFPTEVLFASVRHPRHVTEAAKLGVDICTMPFAVFEKLIHHPLTDSGLKKFLEDWSKYAQ